MSGRIAVITQLVWPRREWARRRQVLVVTAVRHLWKDTCKQVQPGETSTYASLIRLPRVP